MPQSDFQVDNIEFQPFRLEMNGAFLAAITDSSGATEPTVKFPFMRWADTANNLLKVRKADNQSWLIAGRLDQAFFGITPNDIGGLTKTSNLSDIDNRETAKANLAISNGTRNRIINGDFRVNQRGGSSYNLSTTTGYTLDRWFQSNFGDGGTIASGNISQQTFTAGQNAVPNEPQNYLKITNTTQGSGLGANSSSSVGQAIEDLRLFAGQTITISFWAQTTITGKTLGVELLQNFGSGGSATVIAGGQQFALSGTWQRFSFTVNVPTLSGKTLGNNHYHLLNFYYQSGSNFASRFGTFGWQGTGDVNIANVQVEVAPFASTFEKRTFAEELQMCQRYYEEVSVVFGAHTSATTGYYHSLYFKQNKRIIPFCSVKSTLAQTNVSVDSFTATQAMTSLNCTLATAGGYALNVVIAANAEL